MPERNDDFTQAVSDLANALQAAAPLATQLRRELGTTAREAVTLEAAIERAVRAIRQIQTREE